MDASARLASWQSQGLFHAVCQHGEAPRRVKWCYRALHSAKGESRLREASKQDSLNPSCMAMCVCLPGHTHVHTCVHVRGISCTDRFTPCNCCCRGRTGNRSLGGSRSCGSAPGVSGWEVHVSCQRSARSTVLPRDTNHEHTLKQLGVPSVPHLLPIIHQRRMAGGRGEGAWGSLTPLRAECLGLGRIQTYYKPPELLISWISVMSQEAFSGLKRARVCILFHKLP